MMANYAVGDIQGCFEEFKEGLELINFKSSKDFLWITGDLINRGPESLKVLEYVFKIRNSVHIVLGNHDLHYLNCFFNNKNLSNEDTFQSQMFHKKSLKMAKFLLSSKIFFKFFFGSFINSNPHSLDKVSAFLSDIFLGIPA